MAEASTGLFSEAVTPYVRYQAKIQQDILGSWSQSLKRESSFLYNIIRIYGFDTFMLIKGNGKYLKSSFSVVKVWCFVRAESFAYRVKALRSVTYNKFTSAQQCVRQLYSHCSAMAFKFQGACAVYSKPRQRWNLDQTLLSAAPNSLDSLHIWFLINL